jgi:hypothetical protein
MFETRLHDVDISVNADTSPARKSINQLLLDLNKILPGIPLGIPGGDFIPGAMAGINDFRGGLLRVGERGPETLYIPPNPGATVIPNNQSNAPGTVIHQTINVTEAAVPGDVTAFKIASILGERGMR